MITSHVMPLSREVVRTHKNNETNVIRRLLKHNFKIVDVINSRGNKVVITATRRFTL